MFQVNYSKTFLTGNLEGLTVETSYKVSRIEDAIHRCNNLRKFKVGKDATTGAKWHISKIGFTAA